ncbi:MAG: HupE/UreJ family protein [Acidobacteria bacterium]|nr:HupE/UreJ family protein [Acidobacteriota bacterium]
MRQHSSCPAPNAGQVPEPRRGPRNSRASAPSFVARMALGVWLLLFLVPIGVAHPIPDVPLRSFFEADGSAVIKIELDTRCFSQDPEAEPYLFLEDYLRLSEADRDQLRAQARAYADRILQLSFEPGGAARPEWEFEFTTFRGRPLTRADDPVMMTGSWRLKDTSGLTGYQARSLPEAELSLLFLNYYQGEILRGIQVLFPDETSRVLDLSNLAEAETGDPDQNLIEGITAPGNWATFTSFIRSGFVHVVPLGMDHILFVLGLFLLSRHWKPLLLQVTAFTLAHTLTLGMAATGVVHVPASVVEPIIAGSIVVIALENIFYPRYTSWRLLVVFVFGLVHGLGFAGALSQLDLPAAALLVGLLGFNLGVELGQLTVIAAGLLLTIWLRDPDRYRKAVVIPGSLAIAAMGAYWMIERVFF